MDDDEPLLSRVFRFLNDHPNVERKRLYREFGEYTHTIIRTYWSRWNKCIRPLKWLYEFMGAKWTPIKRITKEDRAKLKAIERMLEGEKK